MGAGRFNTECTEGRHRGHRVRQEEGSRIPESDWGRVPIRNFGARLVRANLAAACVKRFIYKKIRELVYATSMEKRLH